MIQHRGACNYLKSKKQVQISMYHFCFDFKHKEFPHLRKYVKSLSSNSKQNANISLANYNNLNI